MTLLQFILCQGNKTQFFYLIPIGKYKTLSQKTDFSGTLLVLTNSDSTKEPGTWNKMRVW